MEHKDIVDKLIREQDLICYYFANSLDSAISFGQDYSKDLQMNFSDVEKLVLENEEIIRGYSVKNLVNLMAGLPRDKRKEFKTIENILMEKLKTEKFSSELIECELFGMQFYHPINKFFNTIEKENLNNIKQELLNRLDNLDGTKFSGIGDKINTITSIAGFLEAVDDGILNDEKLDILKELANENENILDTINFGIFSDEIYGLGKDFIKVISKFPNLSKKLIVLSKNNPTLLSVIGEEINKNASPEKIEYLIEGFTKKCFEIDTKELNDSNKEDLKSWAISERDSQFFYDKIKVDYSKDYQAKLTSLCDDKFSDAVSLDSKKNIMLNKYLAISLLQAKKLMDRYPEEVKSGANDFFNAINAITELDSEEEINDFYNNYTGLILNANQVLDCLSSFKSKYADKYEEVLKETDTTLKKANYEFVEYDGRKIKQIQLTGEFDLFVHSSDAGFVNEVNLTNNSFKESWQKGKDSSNHVISMCHINQDFLGCAPVHGNGVMYGFANLEGPKIGIMGKSDINTYSRKYGYQAAQSSYFEPDNMISNARRVYTEIGVERQNTNPDYIILFSDADETIRGNSYKAALEFGIPIVYVDKEKMKDEQLSRIDALIDKFEDTKDVDVLGEIFNKYETNIAGWLLNRSTAEVDESYTAEIDNSKLEDDFKEKFSKISKVFLDYTEALDAQDLKGNQDLLRIMTIFLRENDKYKGSEEVKPISKTHISFELSGFINQINNLLDKRNMQEYKLDAAKLPTEQEYSVLIQDVVKFALRTKQIDAKEVREVDVEKKRRNREFVQGGDDFDR